MTEDTFLADERWVCIACDYSADGVWDRHGVSCSADELPVPADLIDRIRRWQAWYDTALDYDDFDRDPRFDYPAFATEGFAIARAVKAALPDWTVLDMSCIPVPPEAPPAP